MEKLEPHIILRKGLIAGERFPKAPEHVAEFVAQAAFHTSDLAVPFERKAADVALFAQNLALQRITVDLVFTDPYVEVWRNKVTAPLAAWAAALRADIALKSAVATSACAISPPRNRCCMATCIRARSWRRLTTRG